MSLPLSFPNRPPDQIGVLVPDIAEGMRAWGAVWGVHDWLIYTFSPATLAHQTYRGHDSSYAMRLAIAGSGPQLEVIEPLAGPSIYAEWIDAHGYGVHHIGYYVPSLSEAMREMAAVGLEPIQTGSGFGADGTGHYAYYQVGDADGPVVEFIEGATRRRESETL